MFGVTVAVASAVGGGVDGGGSRHLALLYLFLSVPGASNGVRGEKCYNVNPCSVASVQHQTVSMALVTWTESTAHPHRGSRTVSVEGAMPAMRCHHGKQQ